MARTSGTSIWDSLPDNRRQQITDDLRNGMELADLCAEYNISMGTAKRIRIQVLQVEQILDGLDDYTSPLKKSLPVKVESVYQDIDATDIRQQIYQQIQSIRSLQKEVRRLNAYLQIEKHLLTKLKEKL
jgi:hypothetical protein